MIDFGDLEHEVGSEWGIDRIHAHWMLAVLRAIEPYSVIEIGCHKGVSTTALAQAHAEGCVGVVHLIDPVIQPTVRRLAREGVVLHECRSVDALPRITATDLACVIDGDHTLQCVRDELPLVLAKSPSVIFAHDVTAEAAGFGQCDGSRWLWEELQRLGWHCVVDCRRREQARTHRGFLVATRTLHDHTIVVDAWKKTCLT